MGTIKKIKEQLYQELEVLVELKKENVIRKEEEEKLKRIVICIKALK